MFAAGARSSSGFDRMAGPKKPIPLRNLDLVCVGAFRRGLHGRMGMAWGTA